LHRVAGTITRQPGDVCVEASLPRNVLCIRPCRGADELFAQWFQGVIIFL